MRRRAIAWPALIFAFASGVAAQQPAGPNDVGPGYNCSAMTFSLASTIPQGGTATQASACNLLPSGFSISWTWNVLLNSTVTHAVLGSWTPNANGTGWCGGILTGQLGACRVYANAVDVVGAPAPTYAASAVYISDGNPDGAGVWQWQAAVWNIPPGGIANVPGVANGFGCLPKVQAVWPTNGPLTTAAVLCKGLPGSPIVIDTAGEGFHLTDLNHGVPFRRVRTSPIIQMSWTDPAYHNGWLTLPTDGRVEALSDLFGDYTEQPPSANPNGYLALAVYDLNHDGVIDSEDAIYDRLRVWIDENHDGVCQPAELHTLVELGIKRLSVGYGESRKVDRFGNQFRYVSSIDDPDAPRQRRTYDVFLLTGR